MEISGFNKTDASQTIFVEGMARAQVNNDARTVMGAVVRAWYDSVEGDRDSTGSANAYLLAANRTIAAYADGMRFGFHANFANTGAATLNVDSVGAKTIKKHHDVDLASGDIEANQYVDVVYSASDDTFQMLSPVANAPASTGANTFTASQTIQSADAGAGAGPVAILDRNSASPAASDLIGQVRFDGRDDGGNATVYASVYGEIVDPANGSEDGRINFETIIAGAGAARVKVGAGLYTAGVSDMGVNTINATTLYAAGKQVGRIQRQTTTKTDTSTVALTAGTYADITGMSVAITAVSGNRILIKGCVSLGAANGPRQMGVVLLRDTTIISPVGASAGSRLPITWPVVVHSAIYLDGCTFEFEDTAPDGDAHTYKLQMISQTTENAFVNRSGTDTDNNTFARGGSFISAEEWGV